jgi:hypothetical protein
MIVAHLREKSPTTNFLQERIKSKNNSTIVTTTSNTTFPLNMILKNDNTDNNKQTHIDYKQNVRNEPFKS